MIILKRPLSLVMQIILRAKSPVMAQNAHIAFVASTGGYCRIQDQDE
jgi:hypothetical protein